MIYDSLLVEPENLSIFSNGLAMKMIAELGKKPACAMDLAKKLGHHEQKIYYHLRKMKDAGIIKLERNESRYGMTAKIYGLVSPVISAKLNDNFYQSRQENPFDNPNVIKFVEPFILQGKLNAEIVLGDSYSHGKYDAPATEGPYLFDFAVLLGRLITEVSFPHYKLDTDTVDMKSNLILLGNARTNVAIDKLNDLLPIRFDIDRETNIIVKSSGNSYNDPRVGVIVKCLNPFNKHKKILLLGGVRTRGMQAAIIALTKHFNEVYDDSKDAFIRVVSGYDSKGDKRIDAIKILE